jgi:hypothetical protein
MGSLLPHRPNAIEQQRAGRLRESGPLTGALFQPAIYKHLAVVMNMI